MKRRIGLWLGVLCCLVSAGAEPPKAQLKIDIYEWGNDTVVVACRPWSGAEARFDTLSARDGRLTFSDTLREPTWVVVTPVQAMVARVRTRGWVVPQSVSITTLMLPGSTQRITGWVDNHGLLEYKASGSNSYFSGAAAARSWTLPYRAKIDTIERSLVYAPQDKMEAWYDRRKEVLDQMDSVQLLFLKRSPSNPASGELLRAARYTDEFFDYEKRLAPKVRNGLFKEQIDEMVAREQAYRASQKAKKQVVVGVEAPPIELPDSSGVVRTLAEWKGKWVVIDFWGSWCSWCLHGVPAMKKAYEKHRGAVEFLGVACNDKKEPWRATLVDYALPWVNVFEADKGVESTPVRYGVEAYPTKIVVDPQGKIALYMRGEDPQFYIELDQLISKP